MSKLTIAFNVNQHLMSDMSQLNITQLPVSQNDLGLGDVVVQINLSTIKSVTHLISAMNQIISLAKGNAALTP